MLKPVKTPTQLLALLGCAIAAGGIGACGSSSKNTASTKSQSTQATASAGATSDITAPATPTQLAAPTKPLARASLVAEGDAICARINARAHSTSISKPSDYPTVLLPLIEFERGEVAQLAALTPIRTLKHDWDSIVAARRGTVNAFVALLKAGETGTIRKANAPLTAAEREEQRAHEIARKVGFHACTE